MDLLNVYLSRIIGNKIYRTDNTVLGKLQDLAIDTNFENSKIISFKVKCGKQIKYLNADNISIIEKNGQYVLTCNKEEEKNSEDLTFLYKNILDKQIIDMNGRKVVRVNDIRLVLSETGLFSVAVDLGMEGILRRLGMAKPLKSLGLKFDSKLMMWKDIATIYKKNDNIVLSKSYDKLSTLHPSDLADIIEDFDHETGMLIFSQLDTASAADVLEELEEDTQLNLLKSLSIDKAADILEEMPADEAADILDGLSESEAEEFLSNMEKDASDDVRELLEYEDDEVGSIMNNEFVYFSGNLTTNEVIEKLRELKPDSSEIYYIYVVDSDNKFIGTVSLRDLIVSNPTTKLTSIMNKNIVFVYDKNMLDKLLEVTAKYSLLAIPVVDNEMHLIGNVIINDIVYELLRRNKKIGR